MSDPADLPQLPSVDGPLQVRYLPLSKLARAPRNPKGHAPDVIDNSIGRFGFINPIVINDKTGRIVAGHGRLDTLQRAKAGKRPPERIVEKDGEWYAPVLVGVTFATDAEAEAFLIADNQTVVLGGYDEKILAEILVDHVDTPNGLTGMGSSNDDVANLLLKVTAIPAPARRIRMRSRSTSRPSCRPSGAPRRDSSGALAHTASGAAIPAHLPRNCSRARSNGRDRPPYEVSYGQKTDWMEQHNTHREHRLHDREIYLRHGRGWRQ
jgi:hypothetical protein